jgi:transcriptional regulator with XRE-family HTH domain
MKKVSELPRAVNNLRAIWDAKKAEMKFTQVEAAKELGWSQGAISHYLNNITELGPSAVIKFANFLGVDPKEIDPDVIAYLPTTEVYEVSYDASNIDKRSNTRFYSKKQSSEFWVYFEVLHCLALCVSEKEHPRATTWVVQKKGEKRAFLLKTEELPPKNSIAKQYAVVALRDTNWEA